MIDLREQFQPHPAILAGIDKIRRIGFNGVELTQGLQPISPTPERIEWRSWHTWGDWGDWGIETITVAKSGDPEVYIGHILYCGIAGETKTPHVGACDHHWTGPVGELVWPGSHDVLQGQRYAFSYLYNFETDRLTWRGSMRPPYDETGPWDIAPSDPNTTGGSKRIYGLFHDVANRPDSDFYPLAAAPGAFRNRSGIRNGPASLLIDTLGFDQKSDGYRQGHCWIDYQGEVSYAYRAAGNWRLGDVEHCLEHVPMCQRYLVSKDPVLGHLIRDVANHWCQRFPIADHGTTDDDPRAGRARGRLLQGGMAIQEAVDGMQNWVRARMDRDLDDYVENGLPTFKPYGKDLEGWSPHELGEWWNGLYMVERSDRMVDDVRHRARNYMWEFALMLLDAAVPTMGGHAWNYCQTKEGTVNIGGQTDFIMPAMQWLDGVDGEMMTPDRRTKLEAILAQYLPGLEDKWRFIR